MFSKIHFSLTRAESNAWRKQCRKLRSTEFLAAKAILGMVLYRFTQQNDFVIAYPINCRPRAYKNVPGCFVNTLPATIHVSEGQTINGLVADITRQRKAAKNFGNYPTANIVQDFRAGDTSGSADNLLNVMISQSCLQHEMLEFGGAACVGGLYGGVALSHLCKLDAMSDLSLVMDSRGDTTVFSLHYDAKKSGSIAQTLVDMYLHVLREWITHEDVDCIQTTLLGKHKKREILSLGVGAQGPLPYEDLVSRFEDQARQFPEATAIVDGDDVITFRLLDRLANELAHRIESRLDKTCSSEQASTIALLFPRGKMLIAAMIAVWKTGNAYIPLDPDSPDTFNQTIIANSHAALVLGPETHLLSFTCHEATKLVVPMFPGNEWFSDRLSQKRRTPQHLAYIIFTSGSTGTPKGVMIEDRGIINLADWYRQHLSLTVDDRSSQFASPAFDTFGCEVWPFLLNGSSVVIVPKEVRLSPAELDQWLISQQVTICDLPSSMASRFLAIKRAETSLRVVKFGGEKLHHIPAESYPFAIINSYGPTEASVEATFSTLFTPNGQSDAKAASTIGKPINRVGVFVLGANMEPVPVGMKGELYISGVGLMRGYLNDPDRTRSAMVELSLSGQDCCTAYKTGDIVRWLESGELEYIGRSDHQVQLRGYRLELSAIESMLCQSEMIQEAAAIIEGLGEKTSLVAYIVLKPGAIFNKAALYEALASRYPSYWLPASLFLVPYLPLNGRGKVDKRLLKGLGTLPEAVEGEEEKGFRSEIEIRLSRIWSKVLNRDRHGLSPGSHFYYEGGSSLGLVELMLEIEQEFAIQLSLMDLVKAKTIHLQAELLKRVTHYEIPVWRCFHSASKEATPVILLPPRGAGLEAYEAFGRQFHSVPVYGIESHNMYAKPGHMIKNITALAARNIEVLKKNLSRGPYKLAGWSMGGNVAQEMAKQLEMQGEVVEAVYLFDSIVPDEKGVALTQQLEPMLERILMESEKFQSLDPAAKETLLMVKEVENTMYITHQHQPCQAPCWLFRAEQYAYPASYSGQEKIMMDEFYAQLKTKSANGWEAIMPDIRVIPVQATHKNILQCEHTEKLIAICEQEIRL